MSIPTNDNFAVPLGAWILLRQLHLRGRLAPMIREAMVDHFVQQEARQAGLEVSVQELQKAADAFRRRHGLDAAADTQTWLNERNMSVEDFEAGLAEDVLAAKLRQHVTAELMHRHWQANQADYERLRLALVVVGREELARELATQVRDDGRDLTDIVREHGMPLTRGERFRKGLPGPLAEALASAGVGQLIGPVATKAGFTLALIEERRPAELDKATREFIQNELFDAWLAKRVQHTTNPLSAGETSG